MKISITGTRIRHSITDRQIAVLTKTLIRFKATELHHGDCEGGDDVADDVARKLNIPIIIHPPDDDKHRAFCDRKPGVHEVREPKPYLVRNRDIVDEGDDVLIALPKSHKQTPRSGTWYTINYARKQDVPVMIIFPNGTSSKLT